MGRVTNPPHETSNSARSLVALPHEFFDRDPREVAPQLLGCIVVTVIDGVETSGVIVEAEAYLGADDAGSHASTKGITLRNAVMYGPPGAVYVYFTYGNHYMMNLVCEPQGRAGAVLLRALRPLTDIPEMTERRHGRPLAELCSGPGKLAQALGVDLSDNATLLGEGRISVYYGQRHSDNEIGVSGRVGLSSGHELELRYYVKGDPFVSKGRTGPLQAKRRPKLEARSEAHRRRSS
jgi:DNA-3-methyladenine glycosylase